MAAAGSRQHLAMGAVSVPLAHADDLKDRAEAASRSSIKHADHALEDSSARLQRCVRRAAGARSRPSRSSTRPRVELDAGHGSLDARASATGRCRRKLEHRPGPARAGAGRPRAGRADLERPARRGDRHGHLDLPGGRPAAAGVLLDAPAPRTPPTSPGPRRAASVMVGQETRAYDELAGRRGPAQGPRGAARRGRGRGRGAAEEAAERTCSMTGPGRQARDGPGRVREVVRPASRRPRRRRSAAKPATCASCGSSSERGAADQASKIARAAPPGAPRGYSGSTGGFLGWPMQGGYVTSPYGYRVHPIYGYYGLHNGTDFGGGLRRAAAGGRRRHGRVEVLLLGLRQPAVRLRRQGQRQEPHDRLQPRLRLHRSASASGSRAARSSATSGATGWSTACHLHFTVLVERPAGEPDELDLTSRRNRLPP